MLEVLQSKSTLSTLCRTLKCKHWENCGQRRPEFRPHSLGFDRNGISASLPPFHCLDLENTELTELTRFEHVGSSPIVLTFV